MARVHLICGHTYLTSALTAVSSVLDLGADHGDFSRQIIQRYGCRVFTLEPLSSLRKNIPRLPGLTLLPFAIGASDGTARLQVFDSRCATLLYGKPHEQALRKETVEVVSLRTLLARLQLDQVDLMKVDIEGAELQLFEAASVSELRVIRQITVEFHDFLYPELGPRLTAAKTRLREAGFWSSNFSLNNTDVLFINPVAFGMGRIDY
jgi:FkbM family methyltransferase